MYSSAQPVIVERHLPLMPMGLISPACCWASIDDDLNHMFHIAHGRGTVMTQSGIIRFAAPCAPRGEPAREIRDFTSPRRRGDDRTVPEACPRNRSFS